MPPDTPSADFVRRRWRGPFDSLPGELPCFRMPIGNNSWPRREAPARTAPAMPLSLPAPCAQAVRPTLRSEPVRPIVLFCAPGAADMSRAPLGWWWELYALAYQGLTRLGSRVLAWFLTR